MVKSAKTTKASETHSSSCTHLYKKCIKTNLKQANKLLKVLINVAQSRRRSLILTLFVLDDSSITAAADGHQVTGIRESTEHTFTALICSYTHTYSTHTLSHTPKSFSEIIIHGGMNKHRGVGR